MKYAMSQYTMKQMVSVLCIGVIIALCGFGMAGFNYQKLSTKGVYEMKDYQVSAQSLSAIRIRDKNARVELKQSGDDQVRVEYYERKDDHYTIQTDASGVLSVTYDDRTPLSIILDIFTIDFNLRTLRVYVPADCALPVNLSTTNGTVSAQGLTLGDTALQSSNGKIEVRDITAPAIEVTTSNGSISLDNVAAGQRLRAQTSNGRLQLNHVTAPLVTSRSSNASTTLTTVTASTRVEAITSNGKLTLDNVTAPTISAQTSNASVNLTAVDAQSLDIKSSNGAIRAALSGSQSEYTISSSTINGKNNLPSGGTGPRKLTVKTSNAGINVTFDHP